MPPALLLTKLYMPRLRSNQISRPALMERLRQGQERRLILIAAAAGSGKTSLITEWLTPQQDQVAWLSLDESDQEPARFWAYVIAAIQTCHPDIGMAAFAALQSPQPPPPEHVLPGLINQLAVLEQRLWLVLDDYHVISQPAIHTGLAYWIDHLPPQITIVLASRTDPPLPLPRWRAHHDLLELRAADLRFLLAETTALLNDRMQLGLSAADLHALDSRTEGWIAGLQLAALAMQTLPGHKATFIAEFTGSHRFILDYLMEEVLARQPAEVRQFLLHTSVLHRLHGSLCEAVAGAGQAMLAYLEKNNLFLVPLDQARVWYRYHHLFADLLHARLQAETPALIPDLYQRAADWHAAHDLPEIAVDYALLARNFEQAAALITGAAVGVSRRGDVATLLRWYEQFPPGLVVRQPALCLQFVLAFALNGRWEQAAKLLHEIDNNIDVPDDLRLLAQWLSREQHPQIDVKALTATAMNLPATAQVMVALLLLTAGQLAQAGALMAAAQHASTQAGDQLTALTALFHRCRIEVFRGHLQQAHDLCQQALAITQEMGASGLPLATFTYSALGRLYLEWNQLDQADHALQQALHLAEQTGFLTGVVSSSTMMLAEVQQARGDATAANRLIEAALSHATRYDPPDEVFWLKAYRTRIWLAQGQMISSVEWLQEGQKIKGMSLFYPQQVQTVTQARVLLYQRRIEEAIALLMPLVTDRDHLWAVEALGVLVLARQAQGDITHALLMLTQALDLAAAEHRDRALLDLGQPMAKLLARWLDDQPGHGYATHLRRQWPAFDTTPAVDALSERELEVLRLIAAGYSNEEIAQQLTVALSTVKWYINGIYGKLHVKTRGQAIARAHSLGLIQN